MGDIQSTHTQRTDAQMLSLIPTNVERFQSKVRQRDTREPMRSQKRIKTEPNNALSHPKPTKTQLTIHKYRKWRPSLHFNQFQGYMLKFMDGMQLKQMKSSIVHGNNAIAGYVGGGKMRRWNTTVRE